MVQIFGLPVLNIDIAPDILILQITDSNITNLLSIRNSGHHIDTITDLTLFRMRGRQKDTPTSFYLVTSPKD